MTRTVSTEVLGQPREDFLADYTEVDIPGKLTVAENTIDFVLLDNDEEAYVYIDLDSVPEDFQFDFKPSLTNQVGGFPRFFVGFADAIGGWEPLKTANDNSLMIDFYTIDNGNKNFRTRITEIDGGVESNSGFRSWSFGLEPHIRLWRRGGMAYVKYYLDPNYVDLNLSNDLALTATTEYRYFYAFQGRDDAVGVKEVSGSINDLTIRPARYKWQSGLDFQDPRATLGGNAQTAGSNTPGWHSINNKRFCSGIHSFKAYSRIGGASGRVRAWGETDFDGVGARYGHEEFYARCYVYVPSTWPEYINPLVLYSGPRTEYLMWVTLLGDTYIDVRRYYPADVTYRIDEFVPETDKWMGFILGMEVHATDGWYGLWYSDADKKWKPELIWGQTGLNTSGASDCGNQPKFGIVHFGTNNIPGYSYTDEVEYSEIFPRFKPFPKYPTRLQASE